MTLLKINLTDVLSETYPGDKVKVWSPILREGPGGGVVNTRQRDIYLVNGVGEDEVVPGPLIVQIQCKGISDSRPREVVIPDQPEVTLLEVMESTFTYTPPVVGQVAQMRDEAVRAAADAEAAATTAATNVETQLSGHVASAEDAAVRAEAGAATVGDAQTVLDARDTAVDAADRAAAAAAAVAFTEDPAGSGLYTFPTTAGA